MNEATSLGFDSDLHPQASKALKRLAKEVAINKPVSLEQIDRLRQIVRGATKASGQPGGTLPNLTDHELTVVDAMVDKIDDFTDDLLANPKLLSGTTPETAKKALQHLEDGRKLNRLWRRSEMLDSMYERAELRGGQYSQSGLENGLRIEYRQLATRITRSKGLKNMFSEAERNAIKRVAVPSTTEKVARQVGKLSPLSSGFSLGAGGAAGYYGDPLITAGLWGPGLVGQGTSLGLAYNNLNKARNALMGLPIHSYPFTPYANPMAASAATLPLREDQ